MSTIYKVIDNNTCHGFTMGDAVIMNESGNFTSTTTGATWEMEREDYIVSYEHTNAAIVEALVDHGMLPIDARGLLETMRPLAVSYAALQTSINTLIGVQ